MPTTQWIFTFHAGLVEGKLYWLHLKGRMATKFTNQLDYHVRGAMLQAFHKFHPKPKTISELKKVHCSRSGMTCRRQRLTKLSTTFANVWTHAFRPVVDILSTRCTTFNPAKSQLVTFGGKNPHCNKIYMNGATMLWVEKVSDISFVMYTHRWFISKPCKNIKVKSIETEC